MRRLFLLAALCAVALTAPIAVSASNNHNVLSSWTGGCSAWIGHSWSGTTVYAHTVDSHFGACRYVSVTLTYYDIYGARRSVYTSDTCGALEQCSASVTGAYFSSLINTYHCGYDSLNRGGCQYLY
jgi:hypothetical protein